MPDPQVPMPTGSSQVLVVEDDRIVQKVIVRVLERLGFHAEGATNGLEAIAAVERRGYDAILMDCQMPEMDGFEATRAIRRRDAELGVHTPIIALTAMPGARRKCLDAGMDDYLSKPVRPETLGHAIRRAASLAKPR